MGGLVHRTVVPLLVYVGLIALALLLFNHVPSGFVPSQDKQYLVAFAQLPDAATLDRTEAVIRRMSEVGLKQPGVENAVAFPGLSINGFVNSSNAGIVFFTLKAFDERKEKEESGPAIANALNQKFSSIEDAFVLAALLAEAKPVDFEPALEHFQSLRRARTRKIQRSSWVTNKLLHLREGPAIQLRDERMARVPDEFAWIHEYDVQQALHDAGATPVAGFAPRT